MMSPGSTESTLKYDPLRVWDLTPHKKGEQCLVGSLTGVVAS